MAWTIHAWSAECREGFIVSPHFGPFAFGAKQNVLGTIDFVVGEEVIVQVSGCARSVTIDKVFAARQRQPAGTDDACLVAMNGHLTACVASPREIATLARPIPPGCRVFCIVTDHGEGPDGPHVYVVARGVAAR